MADNFLDWAALLDASGGAGEPVPAGVYDAKVLTAKATKSSTQKTMFKLQFQITTGPFAGRGGIWSNLTISPENPNALGFFFRHMAALGFTREYFAQQPQPETVAQHLQDRPCVIKLGIRQYQGQPQNDVESIMPPGQAGGMAVAAPVLGVVSPAGAPALPGAPVPPAAAPAPAPAPAPAAAPVPPAPAPAPAAPAPAPAAPAAAPAAPPVPPAPAPAAPEAPAAAPAPAPAPAAPAAPAVETAPAPAPPAPAPAPPAPEAAPSAPAAVPPTPADTPPANPF